MDPDFDVEKIIPAMRAIGMSEELIAPKKPTGKICERLHPILKELAPTSYSVSGVLDALIYFASFYCAASAAEDKAKRAELTVWFCKRMVEATMGEIGDRQSTAGEPITVKH